MGASHLAMAQQAETHTYATYFYCDATQQERADEIVEQLDKPLFDAAVASGSLSGWGWLAHHTGGKWRRVAGTVGARGKAVFSVYYVCDMNREAQADELIKRVYGPMYDKLVAEGKLTTWGWMEHVVGGEYRRLATLTAKDMSSLMAARGAIVAAFRDDPLSDVLDDICGSHADCMWEGKFEKP